ncbi:acyl carrier protein [Spirochaetota bacterium]
MADVLSKIREIIARQLDIDPNLIKKDSHIIEDLGADSIDIVELVMAFELEFNIEISFEDEEKLNLINEIEDYIKLKKMREMQI